MRRILAVLAAAVAVAGTGALSATAATAAPAVHAARHVPDNAGPPLYQYEYDGNSHCWHYTGSFLTTAPNGSPNCNFWISVNGSDGTFFIEQEGNGLCLDYSTGNADVQEETCDYSGDRPGQVWSFANLGNGYSLVSAANMNVGTCARANGDTNPVIDGSCSGPQAGWASVTP